MAIEFKLPELGEQIESGKVVNILVQVGDQIDIDQPILEVETDKALVEVPSAVKGIIKAIHLKAGEDVGVGQTILTVEEGEDTSSGENGAATVSETPSTPASAAEEQQPKVEPAPAAQEKTAPVPESSPPPPEEKAPAPSEALRTPAGSPVAAAPSTRRLAREIGIDINQVAGSDPQGRISADDVKRHAHEILSGGGAPSVPVPGAASLPDFAKWGEVERVEMDGIRRATSQGLSRAWSLIPQVTQCEKADITEIENFRKKYGKKSEAAGGKLTVTAILLKVTAAVLKAFPKFSASIDPAANQIIYKKYVHIGVAVDTEHGLLVPVIRDVDRKSLVELSVELSEVAGRARQRKLALEEMQGGCITITNLGGFGGTYFTPIVNWPEVAILGVSRARMEPVYAEGKFRPRLMLPLQVTYDHRLIDGADGIRFLRRIADALENPLVMSLES